MQSKLSDCDWVYLFPLREQRTTVRRWQFLRALHSVRTQSTLEWSCRCDVSPLQRFPTVNSRGSSNVSTTPAPTVSAGTTHLPTAEVLILCNRRGLYKTHDLRTDLYSFASTSSSCRELKSVYWKLKFYFYCVDCKTFYVDVTRQTIAS